MTPGRALWKSQPLGWAGRGAPQGQLVPGRCRLSQGKDTEPVWVLPRATWDTSVRKELQTVFPAKDTGETGTECQRVFKGHRVPGAVCFSTASP